MAGYTAILLLAVALAGCGDNIDASFEFRAQVEWSSLAPEVTSVTIDGAPLAMDQQLELDLEFPSYEEAKASFVPLPVVVTTMGGTRQFELTFGACEDMPDSACGQGHLQCGDPITFEADHDILSHGIPVHSVDLLFGPDGGSCRFASGATVDWISRAQPGTPATPVPSGPAKPQ